METKITKSSALTKEERRALYVDRYKVDGYSVKTQHPFTEEAIKVQLDKTDKSTSHIDFVMAKRDVNSYDSDEHGDWDLSVGKADGGGWSIDLGIGDGVLIAQTEDTRLVATCIYEVMQDMFYIDLDGLSHFIENESLNLSDDIVGLMKIVEEE
jgi:hypothetical protein